MDFRVLGPVGISDHEDPISVGGSKPRLLLAVLLAHRNRVVSNPRWPGNGSPPGPGNGDDRWLRTISPWS